MLLVCTAVPALPQLTPRTGAVPRVQQPSSSPTAAKPNAANEFPYYALGGIEFKCNDPMRKETVNGIERWATNKVVRGSGGTLRVMVFRRADLGSDARTAAAKRVLAAETIAPFSVVKRTLVRKEYVTYATHNPKRPTTKLEVYETTSASGEALVIVIEWDIAYGSFRSNKNISSILATMR
jgi:hypothetical protein